MKRDRTLWAQTARRGGPIHSRTSLKSTSIPNTPPEPWPANEWFHLAATYDQNANGGAGDFAMYFNGVKIRGGAPNGAGVGTTIGAWDFQQPFNYYDGLGIGAVYDSGGRRMHGLMDELYIFTRSLSESEIQTLVNIAPPGVEGDYNADGRVDAADYVVWRKNPEAFGGDPGGYNTWRTNFGRMAAAAGQSAVPEPGCFALAFILIGGVVLRRRR